MAVGRCAGCGKQGSACKVEQHLVSCEKYIALFKNHPERALLPEAEYERYKREDRSPEAKAEAKEQRLHATLVDEDRRRASQEARWATPKDILAD